MSAIAPVHSFLLARFATFYEEVARIKLAVQKGELVQLLQPEAAHAEIDPRELTERVANRLLGVLDRQSRDVANSATEAELEAYRRTRYVMTALADEIFILNLHWPGADHWPEHLLEYTVEHTRIAGRQFFVYVQALMGCRAPTPLDVDFAAVLLLALQLGFQGMYRGQAGQAQLREYRSKLYKLAGASELGRPRTHVFAQAYEYTVVLDRDNTRIALGPWVRAAVYGAIAYLVISSVVWVVITWSLLGVIERAAL